MPCPSPVDSRGFVNYFTSLIGIAELAEANRSSLDKLLLAGAYENSACAGVSEAEADAASEIFHKG